MRNIIVPVNFSPISTNAARYAADLAMAAQADLYLFHVLELPVGSPEFPITGYVFDEMKDSAEQALQNLNVALAGKTEGKLNIFTHLEVGGVEERIEAFCQERDPFLVVMGTSAPTLERSLTGGNLTAAIRRLNYPLIVVPENVSFRQIKKVLLACDLVDISGGIPMKLSFLQELQDLFGTRFEVLNVVTKGEHEATEDIMNMETWKESVRQLFPDVHFLQTHTVEEGIGQYLDGHPADMLLVFPKKHSFFEFHRSHAKRLALGSAVPVMSIHA